MAAVPTEALAALARFEKAVKAMAFKGCARPEEHAEIEREYEEARAQVMEWLE